jgi:hypothetical protein
MTRFSGVAGFGFSLKPITIPDLIPTVFNSQSNLSVPNTSPLPQTDPERGPPSLIPIKTPLPLPLNSLPSSPSFSISQKIAFRVPRSPTPRLTPNPLNSLYSATKMAVTTLNLGVVDFDDPTPTSEQPRDTSKRDNFFFRRSSSFNFEVAKT